MLILKNHINKFEDYQIYILNDGRFALITGVQPANKIHPSEKDRICYVYYGITHSKSNNTFDSNVFTLNDTETGAIISFDVSDNEKVSLKDLRRREAKFIGKLNDDAMLIFSRAIS